MIGWDINIVEPHQPKRGKAERSLPATLYQVVYRWKNIDDEECEIVMATSPDEEHTIEALTRLMEKYGEDGEELPLDSINGGSIRKRGGPYMARFEIKYIVGRTEKNLKWKTDKLTVGPVAVASMAEMRNYLLREIVLKKYGTAKLVEQGVLTKEEAEKYERSQLPKGTKIWAV